MHPSIKHQKMHSLTEISWLTCLKNLLGYDSTILFKTYVFVRDWKKQGHELGLKILMQEAYLFTGNKFVAAKMVPSYGVI